MSARALHFGFPRGGARMAFWPVAVAAGTAVLSAAGRDPRSCRARAAFRHRFVVRLVRYPGVARPLRIRGNLRGRAARSGPAFRPHPRPRRVAGAGLHTSPDRGPGAAGAGRLPRIAPADRLHARGESHVDADGRLRDREGAQVLLVDRPGRGRAVLHRRGQARPDAACLGDCGVAIISAGVATSVPGRRGPESGRLEFGGNENTIFTSRMLCAGALVLLLAPGLRLPRPLRVVVPLLGVGLAVVASSIGSRGPIVSLALALVCVAVASVVRSPRQLASVLVIVAAGIAIFPFVQPACRPPGNASRKRLATPRRRLSKTGALAYTARPSS